MKYLKTFEKYDQDFTIDVFLTFMKLLKMHENHFYNKNLISDKEEFKKEFSSIIANYDFAERDLSKTDTIFNLIKKYEKELYNDNKMTFGDNNSLYEMVMYIFEDANDYVYLKNLKNFTDEDIYADNEKIDYDDDDDDEYDFSIETEKDLKEFVEIRDACNNIRSELLGKMASEDFDDKEFIKLYLDELRKFRKKYNTELQLKYIEYQINEWVDELHSD